MEEIKGIGKKTTDVLLAKYRSWKKIKEAPYEELVGLVGEKKTQLIKKAPIQSGPSDISSEPENLPLET
jgi:excinuclease ABC subunit C